jgi:uncharacterized protein (DUF302 family)
MQMRSTKLLIFGNPKAGTPLTLASPIVAIDNLPPQLVQNIAVVEPLAAKAAE